MSRNQFLPALAAVALLIGQGASRAQAQAGINKIHVTFAVQDDDRDPDEPLTVQVLLNGTSVGSVFCGQGTTWKDHTTHVVCVSLNRAYAPFDVSRMTLRVIKHPYKGPGTKGKGWNFKVSASGQDLNGRNVDLLRLTGKYRMGEGYRNDGDWPLR